MQGIEGKLIIFRPLLDLYFIYEPVSNTLSRSIQEPANENVVQGSVSSFTENLDTNLGLIRKEIVSSDLLIKGYISECLNKRG
ncbi:spore germination protein [Gracilibacillus caseinilyticus]|uniref:spore germination protein n=1 Tax=Gracilibacillus caseinilyticus TaxID=2932256 RepID=UPI00350F6EB2